MTTMTLEKALARHGITVPDDVIADIEVPTLTGVQRQGDVGIFPRSAPLGKAEFEQMTKVGREGVQVVRGEATGNTHILDAVVGNVYWLAHTALNAEDVCLGTLFVEEGAVANLLHTDEHGANSIGPGVYTINGKREQRELIRRVAD